MTRKMIIFSVLAAFLFLSGCGATYVRNLKPPLLMERPENVLPLAVAVPVSKDLLEYRAVLKYLEGDTVYIFRSLPDFYVQCLLAHFEDVEVFPEGELIPNDRFDLIARMTVVTEERKLGWATAGFFMVFTLSLEDRNGTPVLTKSIDAPSGVFSSNGGAFSERALTESSLAVAQVFNVFGTDIEASESLRKLESRL